MPLLEICCYSYTSASMAASGGADRVELCGPGEGGLTPDRETIVHTRSLYDISLFVMIRPRTGNFCYSDTEFEQMKESIRVAKVLRADGVVFGVLNPDGTVDKPRNQVLAALAYPMQTTFHKAFDTCPNLDQALDTIVECGIHRILTSGGKPTAQAGFATITHLIDYAQGRITIMAGGGIRSSNIVTLHIPGLSEYHSSALIKGDLTDLLEIQALRRRIDSFSTK
ncbi:MAG TPA: copper homeostasis protein CutC [Bacteroidia bacterium]|jgi:copper homeostasis protein|nr:copper homeostasis protein CutC [Bacteroidia bacterium]